MLNSYKIVLGTSTLKAGGQIKSLLLQKGFNVDGICTSGSMLIRKSRLTKPDIVIINYELTDTNGAEVAKIISGEAISKVILLCTSQQYNIISKWTSQLGIVCMQKPIKPSGFLHTISDILDEISKEKHGKAEGSTRPVGDKLIIDKAKQLLMKKENIEENEAYRRIQKESMNSKRPMLDVAKRIINSNKG
ncbi:ANTAR domain-containing protein [Clostridium sp. YIM B02505]|uniref:Stage 0 sporulation protein A homolog n=1 Tax=Clostridium yunnanense TaxID=2800325 RepID=A0ABS1EVU5_9CLOT|nr:ANTAR domain-containing protein [Clostridium yunnanense]MBK1813434.1 ANTAR domain-containing protein [Clostridium yunnanense]